uniref:Putative defensin n=2 Tax=Triatoma infestans TaxID=30076 RepID=A0A023F6X6_TRIIF
MKCVLLSLVTLFLVAALAYSYPAELTQQQQLDEAVWGPPSGEETEQHLVRLKRSHTCGSSRSELDNETSCNNQCLGDGYDGGTCQGSTCNCSDTFK